MTPAQEKIKRWRANPAYFVQEQFKVDPDAWQIEALNAFADPEKRRISLQACAGPGKSAVLAWCAWNFLACYGGKGEHPNGAAMAITSDNLKDNLWKELAVWRGRSEFLQRAFTWTKERIFANDHPETWFLSARSWSKNANPEEQGRTLSGLHSKYILYLIDESGDISTAVQRAAEQGLSNCRWGKILQAGNPTSQDGMLYSAAVPQRHLWHVIRITGDPDDAMRSKRIDIEWAREQIKNYGRDNPWVMAYILGQFPPSSINALLGVEEVEAAMHRHLTEDKFDFAQKRLGIDAAGYGDDPWVIWPRQGLAHFKPLELRNPRPSEAAARVMKSKESFGSELEIFDDTGGWASGAIDCLITAGYSPIPVNFAGKALDSRFYNRRAEMWWKMAEAIKTGAALPYIPHIIREFTTTTYTFKNGKFMLVDKEIIKKDLGYSPNNADGCALTYALPDMPRTDPLVQLLNPQGKLKAEYDPFATERLNA
jgi:phage terminase large subunit